MKEKDEEGFTVRDRRTASPEAKTESAEQRAGSDQTETAGRARTEERQEEGLLPEPDFSSFILSLAAAVQVSLGSIPNPQNNRAEQNLPAAKQVIDILAMLKEKTKGNLNEGEQGLIDHVLYNLRMQYIKAAEGK